MQKICSNNRLGYEVANGVNYKNIKIEKDVMKLALVEKEKQRKDNHTSSVTGRPNIDVISKRNEEEAKQERKSVYIVAGVLILLIGVVVFLVYFFS